MAGDFGGNLSNDVINSTHLVKKSARAMARSQQPAIPIVSTRGIPMGIISRIVVIYVSCELIRNPISSSFYWIHKYHEENSPSSNQLRVFFLHCVHYFTKRTM
jgi:hypothetical protein